MLTMNSRNPGPNHGMAIKQTPKLSRPERLMRDIERFRRIHKMKISHFYQQAGVHPCLHNKLQDGTTPKPATEERLRRFMREFEA